MHFDVDLGANGSAELCPTKEEKRSHHSQVPEFGDLGKRLLERILMNATLRLNACRKFISFLHSLSYIRLGRQ